MAENEHIYDKVFKRILTLSNKAVIALINGLFNTHYPLDSKITYNATEHIDNKLVRTIADTILTINHTHSYHIEAQVYKDTEIIFRAFDYGYHQALKNIESSKNSLKFPEPMIIYFGDTKSIPKTYLLNIDFGTQGNFFYQVPVCNFTSMTLQEIKEKNMVILLPLYILKLRKTIKKDRSLHNYELLKSMIFDDIINIIDEQLKKQCITPNDARILRQLLFKLYNHLYGHYAEFKEGGLSQMVEDALILDIDILEYEYQQKMKQIQDQYLAKVQALDDITKVLDETAKELDETTKELDETTKELNKSTQKLETQNRIILAYKLLAKNTAIEDIITQTQLSREVIEAL